MSFKPEPRVVVPAAVAVIALLAGAVLWRSEADASTQATDDAYVEADMTAVSPRVSGTIASVAVQDNQAVHAGDLLFTLDDRDLAVALDKARADATAAQAAVQALQATVARQDSLRRQARAALEGDEASLELAALERSRYAGMAGDGSGSQQAREQAEARWRVQRAAADRDAAALSAVEQQTQVLLGELEKARAGLAAAKAAQQAAELNLSYARVVAPVDGTIALRSARVGAYAPAGKPQLTLVPRNSLYVTANLRETQLQRVRAGQPVRLSVDALPATSFKGRVASLGPSSGVALSALPAHNATGNFTKIVQRLPVRIELEPGQAGLEQLKVGMSVRPEIDVAAAAPHESVSLAATR